LRYPELAAERVVRALEKAGFYVRRQTGSHVVMRRDEPFAQTIVPRHASVKPVILHEILKQAGLELDDFLKLV
jgi:predicted RNA binding protein YcfA (HicA-like mRNA interferase family)